MNKFIVGAVVSVFLLLSAEAVYADGPMEEVHVTGQRIYPPAMGGAFPTLGGDLSFNPGNAGLVDELSDVGDSEPKECVDAETYKQNMAICLGGVAAGGFKVKDLLKNPHCAALWAPTSLIPPLLYRQLARCLADVALTQLIVVAAIFNCQRQIAPRCE
ncbi:MAG: hypothetical protein L3J24_12060 [Xanthomonadales bacterium]|nr:hypothetical protein [Xanthomonadales bacterium]